MRTSSPRRHGFTLVELLVVIGIIAVLIALLLPAVQQAREAARRTQCRNNLHQIGIALHNYHSDHGVFPPGCVGSAVNPADIQGWGWAVLLLPYVDQQPLYASLGPNDHTLAEVVNDPSLQPLLRTALPVYRCASDVGGDVQSGERTLSGWMAFYFRSLMPRPMFACINLPPPTPPPPSPPQPAAGDWGVTTATSNYVGSFGDFWQTSSSAWQPDDYAGNGLMGSNRSVRIQDVTDGSSQTFLIGERSWNNGYAAVWAGTDGWNRCEREGIPMVMATAYYPMNSVPDAYNLSCDPKGAAAFSSQHSGGANFLMADGSVRFVSQHINFANSSDPAQLGVYQRLGRRNDGQTISEF